MPPYPREAGQAWLPDQGRLGAAAALCVPGAQGRRPWEAQADADACEQARDTVASGSGQLGQKLRALSRHEVPGNGSKKACPAKSLTQLSRLIVLKKHLNTACSNYTSATGIHRPQLGVTFPKSDCGGQGRAPQQLQIRLKPTIIIIIILLFIQPSIFLDAPF